MGTTPAAATFNGTSTYAADLQQEITRAVTIASLPLNQLNSNLTSLQSQGTELATLQGDFSTIQTAIQSLDQASNGGSLAASVSDNTVATATLDSSAAISGGTYDLNVISAGSPTTTISNSNLPTVADPSSTSISPSSSFTLTVDGTTFTINPSENTLNSLVQAINSSGAGVNATLVNLGPPSAPDYKLSVQSVALGNVAIQLSDSGGASLLSTSTTGSLAQYQVNGQPSTPILSDSSTVTLAPGLTADLLAPGTTAITVASSSTGAASAISSFVSAYNAAATELDNQHGTAGGPLTGQSIVFSLEQALRSITNYSGGTGAAQSLADLGLTFSQTGQLSFNQAQFASVSASNPSDVAAFLGSASGGTGFLGAATNILNGLDDPTTGLFQSAASTVQSQINSDNQQITATQQQVTAVQNQMTAQMAAADSLIASLQSQVTYYTGLFTDTQSDITNS
jgi:flagellar hook-associated protein 2